ncbi:MocR-like pyridoxine biosynthesis transcription factor PdxR [Streptomyces tendae]|uniref:MocR-like pyridoxine biosynthesis transcription factor PdxR n=1 Tax=Streptomyces tendae TaxID=1932 RepID=UPI003717D748
MSLHMTVDVARNAGESLTSQIQRFIKREIADGVLHPGTRLPSSRRLAGDLDVSRSVVVEAYEQLAAEGYLEAAAGSGTRVVGRPGHRRAAGPALLDEGPGGVRAAPAVRWDLRTGGDNVPDFPRREWLLCYQRVLGPAGPGARAGNGYPPLAGEPVLRAELAGYLGRVRGVRTRADHVLVVSGFAQALALLCTALARAQGVRDLALEDPGHPGQRRFVEAAGLQAVPVPVDEEGIDVDALAASGARAVLVTPGHQFPTGAVLSARRREALARWARERDGWVIEDDYDAGLWYDRGAAPPALQRLAPERVVYAGTVSKTLSPALRLGWLAAPERLFGPLLWARERQDLGSDAFSQLALAELLGSGLFDRHLRRLRERARERRTALDEAVRRELPAARVLGPAAGLHAYVRLGRYVAEETLVAEALRGSVLVRGGSAYRFAPERAQAPAVVVGHAHLPRDGVAEAVRVLGAAARTARRVTRG